jgi:hypothetical protein
VIDELLAAVARAEENAEAELRAADETYTLVLPQYCGEAALAGVA